MYQLSKVAIAYLKANPKILHDYDEFWYFLVDFHSISYGDLNNDDDVLIHLAGNSNVLQQLPLLLQQKYWIQQIQRFRLQPPKIDGVPCEVWQTKALCLWDLFFVDLAWYRYTIIFCIDLIIFVATKFFQRQKNLQHTSILDCEQSSTDGKFCQKLWTLRASALHWLRLQCFAECTSKEVQGDSNEFDRPAAEHKNTRTPRVSSIFNAISRLVVLYVPRFI